MKCKACRQPFEPRNSMQRVCGFECALALVKKQKERSAALLAKEERRERAVLRVKLMPRGELLASVQSACNRYVRLRDAGKPCICCGKPIEDGMADAGHYISRGHAPELRFNLDNIHAQARGCNRGRTPVPRERFRAHMLARIGPDRLAALEGPHEPAKWTRDELIAMRAEFNRMARELEKE